MTKETLREAGDRAASFVDQPRIAILLATYRGAAFLTEQLRSLQAQNERNWVVVIRDDLSTDATGATLDEFAASLIAGRVLRLGSERGRLGALGNFLALLEHAPPARYYAFCDQDDVWLPDKLSRAVRTLEREPVEQPVLYCARQRLVDGALHELGLSPVPTRPPSLRNALVQNIATGCTIVINEAARRAVLAVPPPPATLHDWWSYLVTTAVGGRVVFDPHPVILYRQHTANTVGAVPSTAARALGAARRGPGAFMRLFLAHAEALLSHPNLTEEARSLLHGLVRLPEASLTGKIIQLARAGLYRQGGLEQAALYVWVALWHLNGSCRSQRH